MYNKIKDASYHIKLILFLISILIIFSGWYLNNVFSGRFVKKNADGTFTITYKLQGKRVPLVITKEDFRF